MALTLAGDRIRKLSLPPERPGKPCPGVSEASSALSDYYEFNGMSRFQVEHLATTPQQVRDVLNAYEDLGITEVNLFAWSTEAGQLDRIAEATA